MIKNLLKKLLLSATLVCAIGASAGISACNIETDHPEVTITVGFNEKTYDLKYTLYRNMYPNTVRHFMELAQNDFYKDVLIHNYTSNDWFTGGYYYDSDSYADASAGGEGAMSEYLESHSTEKSYLDLFDNDKLTYTVFRSKAVAEDALPTLIGEFKNNIGQVIEKGALTASFGSLKMFYYEKTSTEKLTVTPTADQIIPNADYKYNCATSLFMIQVGTSSSYKEDNYCVFGRINNSSDLTNLADAIKDYLKTLNTDTVSANNVTVENDIEFVSEEDRQAEQDFVLPAEPIIIKSVAVTKF